MFFRKKKDLYIISFKEKKWKIEFSFKDIFLFLRKSGYRLVIFALVVVFTIFITKSHFIEAQTAYFYAGSCLGDWEGPQHAQGEPQAISEDSSSFNSENSAVSRGKDVSMFCGNFQGDVPNEKAISKATLSFSLFVGGEYIDENLIIHATTTPGRRAVNGLTYIVNEDGTLSLEGENFEESFYDILDAPEGAEVSFTLTEGTTTTEEDFSEESATGTTENRGEEKGDGVVVNTQEVGTTTIDGSGIVDDFYEILDTPTDNVVEYSVSDENLDSVVIELPEEADADIDTDVGLQEGDENQSVETEESKERETQEEQVIDNDVDEDVSFLEKIYESLFGKKTIVFAQEIQTSLDNLKATSSVLNINNKNRGNNTENREVGELQRPSLKEKIFEQKVSGIPKTIQEWSYEFQKQAVLDASKTQLFSIEYTFNSVDWEPVGYVTAEEWQNISFVLPIVSWNDISNVQIRVTSYDGAGQTIFLDSIMLSVDYYDRSKPIIEKKTDKKSFTVNEPLHFDFAYDKNKGKKRNVIEKTADFLNNSGNKPVVVGTKLSNIYGVETDVEASINYISDTEWVVDIDSQKRKMRPGKYNLIIEVEDGGEVVTQYQEFYWGVLAINTNKSIYEPNETADLYIGVLDDEGHTVCDASLQLVITDPGGTETIFTTEDGTIMTSSVCSGDTYVEVPDYSTYYAVSGVGKYTMKLSNINTEHEITDSFEVKESVPFVVERDGPTRIYPPATYEMIIKIEAKQDFVGDIYEYLPDTFEIVDVTQDLQAMIITATSGEVINTGSSVEYGGAYLADEDDTQQMLWFLNIYSGDRITIKYRFDAPDISPEFYLLGPLEFYE